MTIDVPGIIFEEFVEDSQVPREENWPEPTRLKIGKGYRMRYIATTEQRESIIRHVRTMADCSEDFEPGDRGKDAGRLARKWLKGLDS